MSGLAEARAALHGLAARVERRPGAVRLSLDGPVATLLLDNPGARNALTIGMMVDLADAVIQLAAWDGATVVLSGAGGAFCAGGHLGDVRDALASPERGREMANAMTVVLDTLLDLPLVSVAAVDGAALGGGAELLTACDHRVASADARIGFVQARLGVACGWGGAARLVAHVGRRTALRALARAELWTAAEAEAVGLVDEVVGGEALSAALAWLSPVRDLPASAVRAAKAQVVAARPIRGGDAEAASFASVWGGPAHLAALARLRQGAG